MQDKLEVVIASRSQEADRIVVLELASPDGTRLPEWSAGAHIDVQSRDSAGNAITRQYSLCGSQDEANWKIAILNAPEGRGGARWLHDETAKGQRLRVSAPRNNFRLHEGDAPAILVAGGIGITPLLAMARELFARGTDFRLHYYARDSGSAGFLDTLRAAPWTERTVISFDDMPTENRQPIPHIFFGAKPDAQLYVCGPNGFMNAVIQEANAHGFGIGRIHKELFSMDEPVATGSNRPFEMVIRSTGQVIQVDSDTSAVAALAQAGLDIIVSCEQGLCGSCLTRIVDGIPEHRDQFMLPEEHARNDCFTPCCSRAVGKRLVLDL